MLNLAIQFLTLLNGLIIGFAVPAIYGLTSYGAFVKEFALVFFLQKSVTIATEPLLRIAGTQITTFSLALNLIIFAGIALFHAWFPAGAMTLLGTMLLSASVLLILDGFRARLAIPLFLGSVAGLSVGILAWSYLSGGSLAIDQLIVASTLPCSTVALLYIFRRRVEAPTIKQGVRAIRSVVAATPQLLSVTAVFNLATNGFPFLLANSLADRDLALFRVITSLVQSFLFLLPINTRSLLASFVREKATVRLYNTLQTTSLIYFSSLAMAALLVGSYVPSIAPLLSIVACVPSLCAPLVAERYLLSSGRIREVAAVNIIVCSVSVVLLHYSSTALHAELLYAGIFSFYAAALNCLSEGRLTEPASVFLLFSPLAVWFGNVFL